MSTRVACDTCLRIETWTGATVDVEQEGGSRKPAIHPHLAAWDTLRTGLEQGRRARGTCVCGQPLLDDGAADAEHPPVPWDILLPDGTTYTVDDRPHGPDGPIEPAALTARLEAVWPRRQREPIGIVLFQAVTLGPVVLAIFTLWLMAATSLFLFLRALAVPAGT
ncbi:MAG: hypothetical protein KC656_19115 [Myxococcales bacterium]|nr:hypothetical protein [Myxococcales bacterium]